MSDPTFPNLTVIGHPLIQHKLTLLRDRRTGTKDFKQLVAEIAMLLAYEVTKYLPTEPVEIETPLERMVGRLVSDKKITLVPILRAGLGMVEGVSRLMPTARVGHIGLARDEESLQPVSYYAKLPPMGDRDHDFIVLDPMLATGGSALAAVTTLKASGARRIRFLCIVAAPQGVRRMLQGHPDVPVYTAALDRELNPAGFIVPGLGDAGDRLFGTL